ncbi:MAG: HAD hydrolase-like protein [Anaerolineales bacterium]|nr:HAD hydrolase-like protein [Anaerolineales bacterium]
MSPNNEINTLLIFDLDGTLLDVFDYHIACVAKVVKEVWNVPDQLPKSKRYGFPQKEIIRRICEAGGVPEEEINRHLQRVQLMLTEQMQQTLPEDLTNRLLPGVNELLDNLVERKNIYLALATGTLGSTAKILLARSGLKKYFPAGAYGHEVFSRQELVRLALDRSLNYYGLNPTRTRVVTIGDAPSDIEAGKSISARTVSVASSSFSTDELARFSPDVLLVSFEDLENTVESILGSI